MRSTISSRTKNESITAEFMNKAKEDAIFDTEVFDKFIQMNSSIRLATPKKICSLNENLFIPSTRQRRVLREFSYAMEMNDDSIKVFAFKSNIDQWRVFIKGPINSPCENKRWHLKISLPNEYPFKPPQISFVSIPYHLNVSKEGRISLNSIQNNYLSSYRISNFIVDIKQLLSSPSIEKVVDLKIYNTFINNHSLYEQLARKSTNLNAKDNFMDFIQEAQIEDEENFTSIYNFNGQISPSFDFKIQPKKLNLNHRPVKASSGVIYFLDELIEILKSENPVYLITGRPLTDKIEDFTDSF